MTLIDLPLVARRKVLDALWNGKWEGIEISINDWLRTYDFEALNSLVHGCQITKNVDILYMVYHLINGKLANPNAEVHERKELEKIINSNRIYPSMDKMSDEELVSYWNNHIKNSCLQVMKTIVESTEVLKGYDERCIDIQGELAYSEEKEIRLAEACILDNYMFFLTDEDERVRKVANLRQSFELRYHAHTSLREVKQVKFIIAALSTKVIERQKGTEDLEQEDRMLARFTSPLFSKDSDFVEFDRDIFENIKDKRILASKIVELINEGQIELAPECAPSCFKREKVETLNKRIY